MDVEEDLSLRNESGRRYRTKCYPKQRLKRSDGERSIVREMCDNLQVPADRAARSNIDQTTESLLVCSPRSFGFIRRVLLYTCPAAGIVSLASGLSGRECGIEIELSLRWSAFENGANGISE